MTGGRGLNQSIRRSHPSFSYPIADTLTVGYGQCPHPSRPGLRCLRRCLPLDYVRWLDHAHGVHHRKRQHARNHVSSAAQPMEEPVRLPVIIYIWTTGAKRTRPNTIVPPTISIVDGMHGFSHFPLGYRRAEMFGHGLYRILIVRLDLDREICEEIYWKE